MAFLKKKRTKTSIRNWNMCNTKARRKAFLTISVLNLSLMETKEDTGDKLAWKTQKTLQTEVLQVFASMLTSQ